MKQRCRAPQDILLASRLWLSYFYRLSQLDSISEGEIPRSLLRPYLSKRLSVWTRADTSELALRRASIFAKSSVHYPPAPPIVFGTRFATAMLSLSPLV